MKYKVRYGSSQITYSIVKSKRRKTSQIIVDKYKVEIRVPDTKTNEQIKKMIEGKKRWIFRKQLEFKSIHAEASKLRYVQDSFVPYFGKNYKLVIKTGQKKNETKLQNSILQILVQSKKTTKKQIKSIYENWMKYKSQKFLECKLKSYSKKLDVRPKKLLIKDLKSRWGSATGKGTINLNLHLLKAPPDVIEYILLHELVHFKIKEHSERFWSFLAQFMADYRDKIRWLEKNSLKLLERR